MSQLQTRTTCGSSIRRRARRLLLLALHTHVMGFALMMVQHNFMPEISAAVGKRGAHGQRLWPSATELAEHDVILRIVLQPRVSLQPASAEFVSTRSHARRYDPHCLLLPLGNENVNPWEIGRQRSLQCWRWLRRLRRSCVAQDGFVFRGERVDFVRLFALQQTQALVLSEVTMGFGGAAGLWYQSHSGRTWDSVLGLFKFTPLTRVLLKWLPMHLA